MLLPDSTFRVTWDIAQTVFLVYIAIVAPIEYAFQLASPEGSFTHTMDLVIDGCLSHRRLSVTFSGQVTIVRG